MADDQTQKKPRRSTGSGSVYQRQRDGMWIAQLSVGPRDARRNLTRTRTTERAARAALKELREERDAPAAPSLEPSLGTWLRSWLETIARPSISLNTYRGYRNAIAHLDPIADVPLAALTAENIEGALSRMTARRHDQRIGTPASPKTVRNVQVMLRLALGQAELRGHIARNPARMVPLRRVPRMAMEVLTPERARDILAAVKDDRFEAAYALALVGLRASEILGLVWDDVDLRDPARASVRVRYQIVGSGKGAYRAPLKSAASESPVPLPRFVSERLVAHRAAQRLERIAAGKPTENGQVFVTTTGYAVNGNWLTKHFRELLAAAGLPTMRLHDLRHGAATLLIGAGAHPRVAQELLRHASPATTMRIYAHISAAQTRTAADLLDAALSESELVTEHVTEA